MRKPLAISVTPPCEHLAAVGSLFKIIDSAVTAASKTKVQVTEMPEAARQKIIDDFKEIYLQEKLRGEP